MNDSASVGRVLIDCVAGKLGMKRDKKIVWHGVNITVRPTLTFRETIDFVQDVMSAVLREDGTFLPEMLDFAFRMNTVARYSDASLPGDLEAQYFALYATDLYSVISANINADQLASVRQSINVWVSTIK